MSTDIIYRSVVRTTGEEVLVYKNIFDKYKDLKSTREFKEDELSNWISLTKMIGIEANINKIQALQLFYDCEHSPLEFHSVYIGDLATISLDSDFQINFEINDKNRVFIKKQNNFIDLKTYESYNSDNMEIGDTIVVNACLIEERFNNELPGPRQSKRKIMTFCNKKFSNIQ